MTRRIGDHNRGGQSIVRSKWQMLICNWHDMHSLRLRLDSLREVRQSARICNKDRCPDNLTLPSLSVASAVELDGRYSGYICLIYLKLQHANAISSVFLT
jgi:hypothetical protein